MLPLRSYHLLVALAVLTAANVPAVAQAEDVGTSAVPYLSGPPQAPAAARPRWHSYNFPAPNAGLLVFTIRPDGNPACASYNGRDCLWGQAYNQIDFNRVQPLVCGADHRAKWNATGYEDRKHWCSLARSIG